MNSSRAAPFIVSAIISIVFILAFWIANVGWHGFSINHQVDAISLATLGVNIFIAFFLQYYFASRASDDRAEKDILLDNLRDAFNMLRSCRDEVFGCHSKEKISKESQRKIVALYHRLSNGLENLQTAIEMSACAELRKECDTIRDLFHKYKAAGTGKFPHGFEATDISYQDQAYRNLNQALHGMAFKINRHR